MNSSYVNPRTLLIASEPLISAWQARAGESSEVVSVAHTDVPQALDTIVTHQPDVVVIEQVVATTAPGATLMARLHNERYLRGIEVRLLPSDRAADLMSSEPGDINPLEWLTALACPLPARPQRRAARMRAADDEVAHIDGSQVVLIDLSASGAQVRSSVVLRPRQRVKFVLSPERGSVKTSGVVAWSTFEMAPAPRYRAGIAFSCAIPDLDADGPVS